MLQHLSIRNYALIEHLDIDLFSGFSVLTGETGAGKSIIIGALGLIKGERAETKYIKKDATKCTIEATFRFEDNTYLPFFQKHDLDYDNEQCLLRRELNANGKSRAFINDTPVSLLQLKELGEQLIDIHSQHKNLLLSKEDFLLNIIDTLAHTEDEMQAYKAAFSTYKRMRQEYKALLAKINSEKADMAFTEFQLQQIDEAELQPNEQVELETELAKLSSSEEAHTAVSQIHHLLQGNDKSDLLHELKASSEALIALESTFPELLSIGQRLESIYLELDDIATEVERYLDHIEADPYRQLQLSERLNLIHALETKHGVDTISALLEIRDRLAQKYAVAIYGDEELEQKKQAVEAQAKQMIAAAQCLTQKRSEALPAVSAEMVERLQQLGMPNAQFQIELTKRESPDASGIDKVAFLFNANKNATLHNITDIASGGEIARVMLSLKAMLSTSLRLPTIIFDEIDTGVSGRVAEQMAHMMKEMSQSCQVLSISHLPQIAACSETHYLVYKDDEGEQTRSHIRRLDKTERIEALAHMLSGTTVTEAALKNAEELLKQNA